MYEFLVYSNPQDGRGGRFFLKIYFYSDLAELFINSQFFSDNFPWFFFAKNLANLSSYYLHILTFSLKGFTIR